MVVVESYKYSRCFCEGVYFRSFAIHELVDESNCLCKKSPERAIEYVREQNEGKGNRTRVDYVNCERPNSRDAIDPTQNDFESVLMSWGASD